MTAPPEYDDRQLVAQATEALAATDLSDADSRWRQFVQSVRQHFKSDERSVATELQRLAKLVEAQSTTDDAMNFKQRTCQTMLMLSMEERHKNRTPAPARAAGSARQLPFANLEVLVIGTTRFQEDLDFYQSLNCEVVWQKQVGEKKFALLNLAAGTPTLLMEHENAFAAPAYSSADTGLTMAALKEKNVVPCQSMEWPNGSAQRFETPSGSGFILCGRL